MSAPSLRSFSTIATFAYGCPHAVSNAAFSSLSESAFYVYVASMFASCSSHKYMCCSGERMFSSSACCAHKRCVNSSIHDTVAKHTLEATNVSIRGPSIK
jgi:hypothetical protein